MTDSARVCGDCADVRGGAKDVPDDDLRDMMTALRDVALRYDNQVSRNFVAWFAYFVNSEIWNRDYALRWARISMEADGHMLSRHPDDADCNEIGELLYQQNCWCGWNGTLTTSEPDAEVAGLNHLRDVGAPDIREGDAT